jgi:enterochelin esterase-like enzyme
VIGRLLAAAAVLVFGTGLAGTYRYVRQYEAYRGFGPPVDHAPPQSRGRVVELVLRPASIGRRPVRVAVYLPAAYAREPARRFPAIYLLQGMPGIGGGAYLDALHLVPLLDEGIARGTLRPVIAVIPNGVVRDPSLETEWADGPRRDRRWFTYLTRDVVRTIDARFRTVRTAAARGIAGYSAGADGAVDALFLRPDVFRVAVGLSGDFRQDPRLVGHDAALVRRFSAADQVAAAAPRLAALRAHLALVVGARDDILATNRSMTTELHRAGVDVSLRVVAGVGHSWRLWERVFPATVSYLVDHLAT